MPPGRCVSTIRRGGAYMLPAPTALPLTRHAAGPTALAPDPLRDARHLPRVNVVPRPRRARSREVPPVGNDPPPFTRRANRSSLTAARDDRHVQPALRRIVF